MILLTLAMAGSGSGQAQGGGGIAMLLPFLLVFAVIYFLMLRPQIKRQKEMSKMLGALKKGDRVLTTGGIYGTIVGIKEKEDTLVLKIDSEVKVELQRSAIVKIVQ